MQAVLEVPDDPVPNPQLVRICEGSEERVKQKIQRNHLPMAVDVIPDLPTNAAAGLNYANALGNDSSLEFKITFDCEVAFVFLPDVVGWRCYDPLNRRGGGLPQQPHTIAVEERHVIPQVKGFPDAHCVSSHHQATLL